MSDNGHILPETRVAAMRGGAPTPGDDFPPRPEGRYALQVTVPMERMVTWETLAAYHGTRGHMVKERDRTLTLGTRKAVLGDTLVDRVEGQMSFTHGWMVFDSRDQIEHVLACFDWVLSDAGPGLELERMAMADEVIRALKVLAAKAQAAAPAGQEHI